MWGVTLLKVVIISMMIDMTGAVEEWEIYYDVKGPIHAEVGSSMIINCTYFDEEADEPEFLTWSKCDEAEDHCQLPDMIFHSINAVAGQAEFKGRVIQLEPDITVKNASIVIRDLRVADTGSYQLTVYARQPNGKIFWYRFPDRKLIKVTGLAHPMISGTTTIERGNALHLTCLAPSDPWSVVTWWKAGIPLKTDPQRADLFVPSVTTDHSGRYICTAHNVTKTLSTFTDVNVIGKCPIPEKSFSVPTVITSTTMMLAFAVLALICTGIYCLAKKCHRCPEKPCTVQPVSITVAVVERATQQTVGGQGVDGVDGPEDAQPKALVGAGETISGEDEVPATTPV